MKSQYINIALILKKLLDGICKRYYNKNIPTVGMFFRNDGRHKVKDTRNRIIIQALSYFTQNNYEKASLNDIAGAINITKGGIYHYFAH